MTIAEWGLTVGLTLLASLVGRLWLNHQRHSAVAVRDLWEAVERIEKGAAAAHGECKGVIERECQKLRGDITRLYDQTRDLEGRVSHVEAKVD